MNEQGDRGKKRGAHKSHKSPYLGGKIGTRGLARGYRQKVRREAKDRIRGTNKRFGHVAEW